MGRSDQYIGLNKIAVEYLNNMSIEGTLVKKEAIEIVGASDTLCGCPIYGSKWLLLIRLVIFTLLERLYRIILIGTVVLCTLPVLLMILG